MISFFPTPYPDELWYSVICRYHIRSGNYCAKHTMQQLYGDTYRTPSLMLCGGINILLPQLPQGYLHTKDIVMQHTFYPYYARFFQRNVSAPPMLILSTVILQPCTGWVFRRLMELTAL